jgi:hypothetical protein
MWAANSGPLSSTDARSLTSVNHASHIAPCPPGATAHRLDFGVDWMLVAEVEQSLWLGTTKLGLGEGCTAWKLGVAAAGGALPRTKVGLSPHENGNPLQACSANGKAPSHRHSMNRASPTSLLNQASVNENRPPPRRAEGKHRGWRWSPGQMQPRCACITFPMRPVANAHLQG